MTKRGQQVRIEERSEANFKVSRFSGCRAANRIDRTMDLGEDTFALGEKYPAGFRQGHGLGGTIEKQRADVALQILNLTAKRRLGNNQRASAVLRRRLRNSADGGVRSRNQGAPCVLSLVCCSGKRAHSSELKLNFQLP